jgi:hypothetical protein
MRRFLGVCYQPALTADERKFNMAAHPTKADYAPQVPLSRPHEWRSALQLQAAVMLGPLRTPRLRREAAGRPKSMTKCPEGGGKQVRAGDTPAFASDQTREPLGALDL